MTNRKNTKRALFASIISMLLCVTMLVGSTFAWFTDNAQTGVNTIEAGTLRVDLVDANDASLEGKALTFDKAGSNELWEPGQTWTLQDVYVKNNGNLALKYRITITGIAGNAELNEVITWTIKVGNEVVTLTNGVSQDFKLAANTKSELLSISGTMAQDAGNKYQGMKIEGISIKVEATQDTVEHDSNNNTYDANAQYGADYDGDNAGQQPDENEVFAQQLESANLGDVITLASGSYGISRDVTTKATLVVPAGSKVTLNLNGHTLQNEKNTVNAALVTNNGELIVNNGTLLNDNAGSKTGDEEVMALKNVSGTATLTGVKLIGRSSTANTAEGGVTVLGGTVVMNNCEVTGNRQGLYVSGTGAVTMTGGKVTLASSSGYYTIANNASGASTFNGVEFVTNSSKSSAAIVYNAFSTNGGSVSFTDCAFKSVNKQVSIAANMASITVQGNNTYDKVTEPTT